MGKSNSIVRILIVDDDEEDFLITSQYIKRIPGRQFVIDWCYQYDEALEKICSSGYDLYFIDYLLGPRTGLELIKDAAKNSCDEPLILLTGKGNHQVDIEAMESGAFDYQIKTELSVEKMERCIRYALDKTSSLKKLKYNETKFRSFFEKSKDAVFLACEDFGFRDVNATMTDLFGYSKEELLSLNLFDLLSNEDDAQFLEEHLCKTNEMNDLEISLLTKNGEKIPSIISVTRERDEHNEVYIQGIIHDITNLRKAEKANLQVEKLSAMGRLARILAHEIRNPLNNINLSVEQLNSDTQSKESKFLFDIIARNSKTINDLISELLNSSRPTDIILQQASLQSIMDQALAQALDRITLKKIQVKSNYPKLPAIIQADADKLKIAFLNVIINSVEAMEEEHGQLHISILEKPGEWLVKIEDNGTGISDENISRLFEPYFTSKKDGLGLGLASTLNIIQSHKGHIEVQTKLDFGTSFLIKFKRASA